MGTVSRASYHDSVSPILCEERLSTDEESRYGISNIRDLLGHKVPLDMIERSAAVRFEN